MLERRKSERKSSGVRKVPRKKTNTNGRDQKVGMRVIPILFALMAIALGLFISKYGIEDGNELVRRKAIEAIETLSKLVSSRVGGSDAKTELRSTDGTAKRFYVLRNGENDGGKNITIKIGEDLSELERHLSIELSCGPVVPLSILPIDTPCRIYNWIGQRIADTSSTSVLFGPSPLPSQLPTRLYMVPPDRHYMWPTVDVGHVVQLPSTAASGPQGDPRLTTLSLSPRAFLVENFFSNEEADNLMKDAIAETEEGFKLGPSKVEASGKSSRLRTSHNAFVSTTNTSLDMQKRIYSFLGLERYEPTWADGIQVLRYNPSQAYTEHLDYMDQIDDGHDYDSGKLGTNRFATLVMYFTDVESGGETCFPTTDALAGLPSDDEILEGLREGDMKESGIERDSWEEEMAVVCRKHLAVKPEKGKAVLFYSQLPNGEVDNASLHGACPVLKGQKWAANLWVWNGPRTGLSKKNEYGQVVPKNDGDNLRHVYINFINLDVEDAALYYEASEDEHSHWSDMAIGNDPIRIKSYVGHVWVAKTKTNGQTIRKWVVSLQDDTFVLKAADLI